MDKFAIFIIQDNTTVARLVLDKLPEELYRQGGVNVKAHPTDGDIINYGTTYSFIGNEWYNGALVINHKKEE